MAMDDRNLQRIKALLQETEVQLRVRENIRKGREEAKVTIGRVAELFDIKPSKLRELDRLLKPERSTGTDTGQRQYSLPELQKLAVISELLREGCTTTEIPPNIDEIWYSLDELQIGTSHEHESGILSIDQRVEDIYWKELFWRYFISRILRLSLMLICEDIPNLAAGLVLPLSKRESSLFIKRPEDLYNLGESLVGWLGDSRSFYTFLTPAPSFEVPSDYRVHPLQELENDVPKGHPPRDTTWIVISRKAKPLSLNSTTAKGIQALLALVYQSVADWHAYFTPGPRDFTDPATNFNSSITPSNIILNGLADMIVRLGGQNANGQIRWKLCCVMLPDNLLLPLQQRSLIIRAQNKNGPYKLGMIISPDKFTNSPSLRALQSGHIIYRPKITDVDTSIAFRELEGNVRSAIAISVGGEYEQPLAVFYVASDEADAFSQDDQRILRMIGKIMEELLITYRVRQQVTEGLGTIMAHPGIIDTLFSDFLSESDFINDIEALLTNIQARKEGSDSDTRPDYAVRPSEEVVSFIAIDVDNQSSLATTYGDRLTKNLSREVGVRLQRQIRTMFTHSEVSQPYHIYADRFCLLLKGIFLEDARIRAEFLRNALKGPYLVETLRVPVGQRTPPGHMLTLPDVTVRLGVASYPYSKLEELLGRYPSTTAVAYVRDLITNFIDEILNMGRREGGNVVMSWDPTAWGIIRWSPPK